MTSSAPTRLYVVAATDTGVERIIRAESKAKAVALASVARIATQEDLERLLPVGVIPEAGEELEPPPQPVHDPGRAKQARQKSNVPTIKTSRTPKTRPAYNPDRSPRNV